MIFPFLHRKSTLALLLVMAHSISLTAFAGSSCRTTQSQSETPPPQTQSISSLGSEISIAHMIIYSQEYMRYFFADNESPVQPLPASGMSLFIAEEFQKGRRISLIVTLPLREEEVQRKDNEPYRYYYPKLSMFGFEQDLTTLQLPIAQNYFARISAMTGFALPLSSRLFKYTPPFLLLRTAFEVGDNVFLNYGFGYSGIISSGAWFFPFGISYRMNSEK